ncbi:MAG: SsrA-binding protein SmpB [Candidatus Kerfeldbacteria bacterium]|nr:SsrA-binding protein SmpB [Candidatus Kerfeldbacteria bacterium]
MPTLTQNKRARYDYEILQKYEAGLVLSGPEVKSAKLKHVVLQGAYLIPKGNELWLTGCSIAPYPPASGVQAGYDARRDRKLLLKSSELSYLLGKMREPGLTLVPLSLYTAHRLVKLEFAVARGKTRYDKRAAIRKRETAREIRSSLTIKR